MIDPGRLLGKASRQRDRLILEIFVRELDKDLGLLRGAQDRESFMRAAHGLKNSAAGVGADQLMAKAAEAEDLQAADWPGRRAVVEEALTRSVARARDEALGLLGGALGA